MALVTKADIRLHLLCIFFAVGSFVWGYNIGILSSVLVHPGFLKAVGHLTPSRKGVITAIYYLGTCESSITVLHLFDTSCFLNWEL
ncbi:hypothetical protein F4814DRAFT_260011 [Daldinia grandis]|nr:hypothetical protein F4814DRAFT_260011 [Daldinia grandis]